MKNPGLVNHGSDFHKALVDYTKAIAKQFEITEPAAMGQLLKLHEAMCKAADSPYKMSSLIIAYRDLDQD